jgi:amino acid transporter
MSPKATVFTRDATGLVREIGWFNFFTFTATGIGFQFSFYFAASLAPMIGGSMLVGFLLVGAAFVLVTLAYTSFMSVMPRAGGDYVYVSRLLNPGIGFVTNILFMLGAVLFTAINAITIESQGLSQLFAYWGVIYNNPSLISLASLITEPSWLFALGLLWIILGGLCAINSLRWYFRIQNLSLMITAIGIICTIAALILIPSSSSYANSFNQFVAMYAGKAGNYYSDVTSGAQKGGWVIPDQISLWGGLLLFPLLTVGGLNNGIAVMGGEMRQASRTYFIGSLLGATYWLAPVGICLMLAYDRIGFSFMSSINWILYNSPGLNPLPAIPYVNLLIAVATNPVLASVIFLAGIVQLIIYLPLVYVTMSRAIFAYSFDGLLPKAFADVSPRTNGPVKAVLFSVVSSCVFLVIISIPQSAEYAFLFASVGSWVSELVVICAGLSCIALAVSKRHRDLEVRARIRGAKLVILGALIVFVVGLLEYLWLSQAVYGANSPLGIEVAAALVILFSAYYVVRRLTYPNLAMVYKEIPPE